MSGGNQVPAGGPREARESLRGWLGRGLARPSVFLSEQRQALRHLVRLLTDVLANSQKKKCRDIPRGVLRTLRAKARACTGRVGRAGLSVFAGAQAQVREGGLHVLIVSFHERFHFRFLRSQGASRVRHRAPECNARLARNCQFPESKFPGLVCLPYQTLGTLGTMARFSCGPHNAISTDPVQKIQIDRC